MSNLPSPELPDLDREILRTHARRVFEQRHDVDDEAMDALIAYVRSVNARRAQPEGEAPQAVPMDPSGYITKRGAVYGGIGRPENGDRPLFLGSAAFRLPAMQPEEGYATDWNTGWSKGWNACREKVAEINLLPIQPAAQQAESGAQTASIQEQFDQWQHARLFANPPQSVTPYDAYVAGLAAQSQSAQTASGEHTKTLTELLACFMSWEPQVRVLGNVRADDAAAAIRAALAAKAEAPAQFSAGARAMIGAVMPCGSAVTNVYEAYEAGKRAQQAAAPGADPGAWQVLTDDIKINGMRQVDVVLKNGVQQDGCWHTQIDWTQVSDWRYSAPGTPEAPADHNAKDAARYQWLREHWTAWREDGESGSTHCWRKREKLDEWIDRAAQLDTAPEAPKELGLDIAVAVNQRIGKYIAANKPALMLLNEDELAALHRFQETCEDSDSGGYDVDKKMMKRLAAIGVIESKGFGRYQFTDFGDFVVARAAQLDDGQEGSESNG